MKNDNQNYSVYLLCFLIFLCFSVTAQLSSNQTKTLINLSNLLPNSPWGNTTTKQSDPCSWKGVSCTQDPKNSSSISITRLSLSNFGLSNSNSTSDFMQLICQIDSLEYLDLSNNHLTSISDEFISDCGKLVGLKSLNFSRNRVIGFLPAFHGFSGLQVLDLSFNLFNGSIDLQFSEMGSLRNLILTLNHFTGSVPTNFGENVALEQLILSKNSFNGTFPQNLKSYQNLNLIDFSENQLSGSLPNTIGELPKLSVLILSSNNFNGVIPYTLWNITTLARFAANQNSFTGEIPSIVSSSLMNLDLSYNSLKGMIPSSLLSNSNLQFLDLSYNLLEGSVPSNISKNMVRLRLGSNALIGNIPSNAFSTLEKLVYLELDNNSLSGFIPPEIGLCKSLALLNVARNDLTGVLPVQLGNLTHLQVLKLELNNLVGQIPIQITLLQRLSTLNMSWNSLSGPIPYSISSLQNLIHLSLQENELSGSIPSTMENMKFLIELQLGKNKLSGKIPIFPRNLQICLNLSNNLFEGYIPNTLSQLLVLEILDLSNNKFSGEIPFFLTRMDSLTQLILTDNQLYGVLPRFNPRVHVNISGNTIVNETSASPLLPNERKSDSLTITFTVVASVLAIAVVAVLILLISRRRYSVKDYQLLPQIIHQKMLTENGIHRLQIDFLKSMEAVANPMNTVLKTRFSTYYRSVMPSGTSYFVKKLNLGDKIFKLGHEKFEQELEIISKISNSNVMIPLAYAWTKKSAYVFYEFCQKGTLYDAIHRSLSDSLDWASRYSIAVGVAQGVDFLHGYGSSSILLLDLSSKTIMLKSLNEPQIGDIELCRVIHTSKNIGSLSTIIGTVGYAPPEYAYTMRVTKAGNVYSFGVVLLELLTGKEAVCEGVELAKWAASKLTQEDELHQILDFKLMSRASVAMKGQIIAVLKVALACVSVSPEARPNIKSALRMLINSR